MLDASSSAQVYSYEQGYTLELGRNEQDFNEYTLILTLNFDTIFHEELSIHSEFLISKTSSYN